MLLLSYIYHNGKQVIKDLIFNIGFLKNIFLKFRERQRVIININNLDLDMADKVLLKKQLKPTLLVGLVKDGDLYNNTDYISKRADYPKYQRFLQNNNIKYIFYDIKDSNWIEEAKRFDIIIWRCSSDPASLHIAKNKIFFLEKIMKKFCYPSFYDVWTYEEKINIHYLYQYYQLPEIPTIITNLKEEALSIAKKSKYPIVSKISTGSSSFGVEKINSRIKAKQLIKKVFSYSGRKTYWPYQRQKDYIYFQKYVAGATYDLRVIVIGKFLFGYYRFPKKGDFRASGSGIYEKKAIPERALELAYKVREKFKVTSLATDMICDEEKEFQLIESSIFIGIDSCEQLAINGVSGYYERLDEGIYLFREGKFWIQELALREVLENYREFI